MKRTLAATLVALAWAPCWAVAQSTSDSGLTRLIEAELARFPAKVGVYVKHVDSGEEAGVLADEPFNTMSVIKVPLMALAYQMAERDELDLDDRVEIREEDLRPGSGELYMFDLGLSVSVRDLILQMIVTSDNTATDLVLNQVGGVARLNEWLEAQGYAETRMSANLGDWFRNFYSCPFPELADASTTEVFATMLGARVLRLGRYDEYAGTRQRMVSSIDPERRDRCTVAFWSDRSYWLGSTTPREMGRILESIQSGTLANPEHTEDMRRVMLRQRVGARRIPDQLLGYRIAHKTGDNAPHIANDVGVVYTRSGPIIMAFFTADNQGDYRGLEELIGHVSRSVVDFFEGAS